MSRPAEAFEDFDPFEPRYTSGERKQKLVELNARGALRAIEAGDFDWYSKFSGETADVFEKQIASRWKSVRNLLGTVYPSSYRRAAREALPATVLFDLVRADLLPDEFEQYVDQLKGIQAATVGNIVRVQVGELSSAEQQQARVGLNPLDLDGRRDFDAREAVAVADALGITKPSRIQQLGLSHREVTGKALSEFLDSKLVKTLITVSEYPARVLDRIAQDISGRTDATFGQVVAEEAGLQQGTASHNLISGSLDAIKVFSLDSFVIFGKAIKGTKALRGLAPVGDLSELNRVERALVGSTGDELALVKRGLESRPVDAFAKWYVKAPAAQRSVGAMLRRGEQLGWDVEPAVWDAMQSARSAGDVKKILLDNLDGVRRLPMLPLHTRPRDIGERVLRPTVRQFRLTWGDSLDRNHPVLHTLLRRYGDETFGDAAEVDARIGPILLSAKPTQMRLMHKFYEDGLRTWATKQGFTPDQLDDAMTALKAKFPHTNFKARESVYGFERNTANSLKRIELPFRSTHLENTVPVLGFRDLLALKTELRRVAGKSTILRDSLETLDSFASSILSPIIKQWLMKPATGARIAMEEVWQLSGHPVIGREFRRTLVEQQLDRLAAIPGLGRWRKPADQLEVPHDILMSGNRHRWEGIPGATISAEMQRSLKALDKTIGKTYGIKWGTATPADGSAYAAGWYHVVNHQIMQDELSRRLITSWGDATRDADALHWLTQTSDGKAYLRGLPRVKRDLPDPANPGKKVKRAETELEKAQRIVDWQVGDITTNLPGTLIQDAVQSMVTGKPMSHTLVESLPLADRPQKIAAMIPVTEAPIGSTRGKELLRQLEEQTVGRGFKMSSWLVDEFSRRPAYKTFYQHEMNRLNLLEEVAKRHGVKIGLSPDAKDFKAAQFAFRETYRMDNPVEKASSDHLLRSVLMFSYAQNNFLKRWTRTFIHNPGYVSRIRNMEGAGEDLGFIDRDDNGTLTFNIPISAEFYSALIKGAERPSEFPAIRATLGFSTRAAGLGGLRSAPYDLLGKVTLPPLIPFATSAEPGWSPLLTVPVAAITASRPDLDWMRNAVLGGFENWDPRKDLWSNVFSAVGSSYFRKLGLAATGPEGDRSYINAVRDYAAWQTFRGINMFDPEEQKKAEDRVRALYALSTLANTFSPFTILPLPANIDVHRRRLQELRSEHPGPEAIQRFLDEQDGAGWPLVVAVTQATDRKTGEPTLIGIAATAEAEEFFRSNREFFDKYPRVAGIFSYIGPDVFDPVAFNRQRQRGMRDNVNLLEWWADGNLKAAQRLYYDDLNPTLLGLEAAGGDRSKIAELRRQTIEMVDQLYPGFAEFQAGWSSRAFVRESAQQELFEAIADPVVRNRADVEPLALWLEAYRAVDAKAKAAGYASVAKAEALAPMRVALAELYRNLQANSPSAAFEQAYVYLFRNDIEDPGS